MANFERMKKFVFAPSSGRRLNLKNIQLKYLYVKIDRYKKNTAGD